MNSVLAGLVIALSIGFGNAVFGAPEQDGKEKAAVAVAEKWLAVVDDGDYAESWKQAAAYFRKAVTREEWEKAAEAAREPFGRMVSRTLKSADFTTSAPGVPDGEYVIIRFETEFEHKKSAVETITPMRDEDGKWRVSGYYIR